MSFIRPATQIARTQLRFTNVRTFTHFTPTLKANTTPSSQGHATQKAKDPIHKDKDIQSSAVRGGMQNKEEAQSNPTKSGEDQPFDAARQGNKGGELKTNSAAGTGAFMDQVGGQGAGGATEGEKVDAAGESYTDMAKNVLTGNFGKGAKKSFHTSARSNAEPSSDAGPKSREPKHEVEPQSDQSPHLKHKDPSKPDSGKGNAAPEPHLPSKQGEQKRGYATRPPGGYSKTFNSEAAEKHDVAPEALPSKLDSAYSAEATPKADSSAVPSHEAKHSSTSPDTAHSVLTQQAKDGTLADRNPPPEAKAGEQGLKEAWKHRKI